MHACSCDFGVKYNPDTVLWDFHSFYLCICSVTTEKVFTSQSILGWEPFCFWFYNFWSNTFFIKKDNQVIWIWQLHCCFGWKAPHFHSLSAGTLCLAIRVVRTLCNCICLKCTRCVMSVLNFISKGWNNHFHCMLMQRAQTSTLCFYFLQKSNVSL